jgi:hypothetical protein
VVRPQDDGAPGIDVELDLVSWKRLLVATVTLCPPALVGVTIVVPFRFESDTLNRMPHRVVVVAGTIPRIPQLSGGEQDTITSDVECPKKLNGVCQVVRRSISGSVASRESVGNLTCLMVQGDAQAVWAEGVRRFLWVLQVE